LQGPEQRREPGEGETLCQRHDTNLAYATVRINDAELRGFVDRTLAFTRR
jgi:hypothetical protein